MLRKKIMKCMLVIGACIMILGCSDENKDGNRFKAEAKSEEAIVTYKIQLEDGLVIESESESTFMYKNIDEALYESQLKMLEKNLDTLNARAGIQSSIVKDDKEKKITIKTTAHFKEVKQEEMTDFFGSNYKSLLDGAELPSWEKVKKSLEDMGLEVSPL